MELKILLMSRRILPHLCSYQKSRELKILGLYISPHLDENPESVTHPAKFLLKENTRIHM